jgi:hypothetical protein
MGLLRDLSDNDVERLLFGRAPDGDPALEEVATFVRALEAAVPQDAGIPDPALIGELARTAGAGDASGGSAVAGGSRGRRASRHGSRRGRLALVARLGVAAAMIPALFAGLAIAGVSLPAPALDAFDRLGLELPNQTENANSDEKGTPPRSGKTKPNQSSQGANSNNGSQGKGQTTRRSRRVARGPVNAEPDPPGEARRRGPNPSPGIPPAKPDFVPDVPDVPDEGQTGGQGTGKAMGKTDGRGRNG